MDWLLDRQDPIEAEFAGRHLREGGIAMFDLSSSWVEGSHCELAARGYSRDGKRGREQIEYGLLTDPDGRPVAIRVFLACRLARYPRRRTACATRTRVAGSTRPLSFRACDTVVADTPAARATS